MWRRSGLRGEVRQAAPYQASVDRSFRAGVPDLPSLLLIPVLLLHKPTLLDLERRAAGHAEGIEVAGHQVLHETELAHHSHGADSFHHVAAHLELFDELADFGNLNAGAPGDSPAAVAIEEVGVLALLAIHRVVNRLHSAHLAFDVALLHVHLLGQFAHAGDHAHDLADGAHA